GFIGEFMILAGSFQTFPILTTISVSGVVLGAVYMLTLYMRTMFGELDSARNGDLTDINARELVAIAPLFILVFVMGVYPQPFLRVMEPTVEKYVRDMHVQVSLAKETEQQRREIRGEGLEVASNSVAVTGAESESQLEISANINSFGEPKL
ncbi:MAG: hypothetical protein KDD60_03215, partial [Bdellovibrionales bacterium]|nr:hypothetical protein [Bdellovibrionales bacterium]